MRYIIIVVMLLFSTVAQAKLDQKNEVCQILTENPSWYTAAKKTEQKWGVPVAVQMAIMHQESHFKATAKNPTSSAYGFAQVLNATWKGYQRDVSSKARRSDFAAASDFIGWYANQAQDQLGISPDNAYNLYIAYHDGSGGYKKASKNKKSLAARLATRVQSTAKDIRQDMKTCESLPTAIAV